MSLQPHWFSTIYGFYLVASQGSRRFAFLIVIAVCLSRGEPMAGVIQPRHFHDWGKFLFAFVMIWTYFSWSQFLITWAGNLPEEISFFLPRIHGGFGWVALAIVLFHFTVPFALLLSRDLKRNGRLLGDGGAAGCCSCAGSSCSGRSSRRSTASRRAAPAFYWLYLAAPLVIGGVWLFFFARTLKSPAAAADPRPLSAGGDRSWPPPLIPTPKPGTGLHGEGRRSPTAPPGTATPSSTGRRPATSTARSASAASSGRGLAGGRHAGVRPADVVVPARLPGLRRAPRGQVAPMVAQNPQKPPPAPLLHRRPGQDRNKDMLKMRADARTACSTAPAGSTSRAARCGCRSTWRSTPSSSAASAPFPADRRAAHRPTRDRRQSPAGRRNPAPGDRACQAPARRPRPKPPVR